MIMQTNIITIAAAVHTTYTVYADVLFLENLVMNFIIISAASMLTKKLFGEEASPLRRLIAAATGALYAVFTVILPSGAGKLLSSFFGKAVLSVLLVYIAFFPKKIHFMLKELLVFCFTGFVFAGTSIAVTYLGVPGTIVGNGFMITSLPSGYATIFLTVGIGYISLTLIVASLKRACINAESYVSLYIEFNGNGIWVPALVDTGNELRDPLTGTPVIIVESKAIQKILEPEVSEYILSGTAKNSGAGPDMSPYWAKRFRIIPFSSLGCESGLLPGFKADSIKICLESELPEFGSAFSDEQSDCLIGNNIDGNNTQTAIICLYDKSLSENKRYCALLSPELVA